MAREIITGILLEIEEELKSKSREKKMEWAAIRKTIASFPYIKAEAFLRGILKGLREKK